MIASSLAVMRFKMDGNDAVRSEKVKIKSDWWYRIELVRPIALSLVPFSFFPSFSLFLFLSIFPSFHLWRLMMIELDDQNVESYFADCLKHIVRKFSLFASYYEASGRYQTNRLVHSINDCLVEKCLPNKFQDNSNGNRNDNWIIIFFPEFGGLTNGSNNRGSHHFRSNYDWQHNCSWEKIYFQINYFFLSSFSFFGFANGGKRYVQCRS